MEEKLGDNVNRYLLPTNIMRTRIKPISLQEKSKESRSYGYILFFNQDFHFTAITYHTLC